MSLSAYLLALGLAANQTPLPPTTTVPMPGPQTKITSSSPQVINSEPDTAPTRPPFLPPLHNWIQGMKHEAPATPGGTIQRVETPAPPYADPNARPIVRTGLSAKTDSALERTGAAPDYSWITGRLSRMQSGGANYWMLQYAPPEQQDRYQGKVLLATSVDMKSFRDGDIVCVHGEVVDKGMVKKGAGDAVYRATRVDIVERADGTMPAVGK